MAPKLPKELRNVETALSRKVERAIDHVSTEFEPHWAKAEKYYNGETDLPEFEGRSQVVKTEVRDAIRNVMPSIMRTLLHARKIVEYIPVNVMSADWVEQQSEYVTQLFWQNDGYLQLFSAIDEATRHRYSLLKTYWEPKSRSTLLRYTAVPYSVIEAMMADSSVVEIEYEESEADVELPLYDVTAQREHPYGKIKLEAVPTYEFFIDEYSTTIAEAVERGVHGHYRVMTVAEAEEEGIEYDDWDSVDAEDPETADHGDSSLHRRGFAVSERDPEVDPSQKMVRIVEAYHTCDVGEGVKLYKFVYVGTNYVYVDHEEVEDSPFDLVRLNLRAHALAGPSIADLTIKEQDISTSMLRAAIDNAHIANNPRYAGDPSRTNFDDLMASNNGPIRTREKLQVAAVPFTGQGLLAMLQYLDLDTQSKVGVTKAAQGLDPDAMQSTDKNAVLNTIQTSQGQVELMVRNIIETALISVFRKMLRLSTRHFNPNQVILTKGKVIPVNLAQFDPDLAAVPNVGLGTANNIQKRQALAFILQKQEQYMQQFGADNPFTSYMQIYNTLEDLLEVEGIFNAGRYFKAITPTVEKQLAERQKQAAQQAQQNAPVDPAKALLEAETRKTEAKVLEIEANKQKTAAEIAHRSYKDAEELDLARDKLIQDRELKLIELSAQQEAEKIKTEQKENDGERKTDATRAG